MDVSLTNQTNVLAKYYTHNPWSQQMNGFCENIDDSSVSNWLSRENVRYFPYWFISKWHLWGIHSIGMYELKLKNHCTCKLIKSSFLLTFDGFSKLLLLFFLAWQNVRKMRCMCKNNKKEYKVLKWNLLLPNWISSISSTNVVCISGICICDINHLKSGKYPANDDIEVFRNVCMILYMHLCIQSSILF